MSSQHADKHPTKVTSKHAEEIKKVQPKNKDNKKK
jgi:hypothetical protein